MSEPIKESKEKKSARQKGMEAWAASIAARQQTPQNQAPEPEISSGGGTSRSNASQRPKKIKTVTKNQKTHETRKNDTVDLARNAEKSEAELTKKDIRQIVGGRPGTTGKVSGTQAPPPPATATQTPAAKTEKSLQTAAQEVVAEEAQTVTAEEVQSAPNVMSTVAAKSSKKSGKTEETTESKPAAETAEAEEEEAEAASLIKPGNDPKASAYVRAGDFLPDGSSDPDLDDYVLAL